MAQADRCKLFSQARVCLTRDRAVQLLGEHVGCAGCPDQRVRQQPFPVGTGISKLISSPVHSTHAS